jgi:hypothetical protein
MKLAYGPWPVATTKTCVVYHTVHAVTHLPYIGLTSAIYLLTIFLLNLSYFYTFDYALKFVLQLSFQQVSPGRLC